VATAFSTSNRGLRKLATCLLRATLARARQGHSKPHTRRPVYHYKQKVSQETLAETIGTTRSSVSFFMNKFRKLGLIDYNGSIEIHSSLLNVVLRDQPQIKR
jgi:CRP-like cAMP-binding protein